MEKKTYQSLNVFIGTEDFEDSTRLLPEFCDGTGILGDIDIDFMHLFEFIDEMFLETIDKNVGAQWGITPLSTKIRVKSTHREIQWYQMKVRRVTYAAPIIKTWGCSPIESPLALDIW